MELQVNPSDAEGQYLKSLNLCFPGWGNEDAFAWAFRRQVGGPPADLMMLRESGELLAGSAVSYRQLALPDGRRALVGIMTGSWTLPAARGRGAFTRIIEASLELTRTHGGALLLAFVTETNASFRRLEAAGSTLFPTRYVSSPAGMALRSSVAFTERQPRTEDFSRFDHQRPAGAHFAYADAAEWAGQLVMRAVRPVLVETSAGAALVETHGDFDRLQALAASDDADREAVIAACLTRAQARGKRIFLFESQPARAERWKSALGLDAANGYLTALTAEPEAAARLLRSAPLASLGPWSLDSGDRM
ncbi:MAG: hypothetical protein ACOZQL_27715 [Myxococcota bacterium]